MAKRGRNWPKLCPAEQHHHLADRSLLGLFLGSSLLSSPAAGLALRSRLRSRLTSRLRSRLSSRASDLASSSFGSSSRTFDFDLDGRSALGLKRGIREAKGVEHTGEGKEGGT